MGAENQITASAAVRCGACRRDNGPEAKFCEGCGQSLYEACVDCNELVMLTQKFCGSCGADLERALKARHERNHVWMAEAVAAAKQQDFEHAIHLLRRVAEMNDYRFAATAESATQAIEKVRGLRDRSNAEVNRTLERAKQAFDDGNKAEVVRLLQSVPAKLLSDESKKILAKVKSFTDQVADLESELRSAIAGKEWPLTGRLLSQLLELSPQDKQYDRLAGQVADRLVRGAKAALGNGCYDDAARQLDAIPWVAQQKEIRQLRDSVEVVHWLSKQFDPEPFASPLLGRLAVRFSKEAPTDKDAEALVKDLAAALKTAQRSPRNHLPPWRTASESWMGGKAGLLSQPTSVDTKDDRLLKSVPGRFNVAIGLALQGLGRGRVSEHFAPKQGLLKTLGLKKRKACWGIDIGSASMKAVCLEEQEGGPLLVVDSFYEKYAAPLCRSSVQDDDTTAVESAIANFLESRDVGDTPIWANLSASKLVSRFLRLPPVKDKAARSLLDQEVDQKIPIAVDELSIARWIGELGKDQIHGRPALITAARRQVVESRLERLRECGLTVTGLQADTTALVNFAVHEFAEEWSDDEQDDAETPAVALIDCGASCTNLVLVSGEAHWSWTLEAGGEDMTALLARETKTTHGEAEQLKHNPAALVMPATQYKSIEQRQSELRVRLQTSLAEALRQNPRFKVSQCWCFGGECLSHGWVRRVLLA